jgi:hypothetical protein
VEKPVDSVQHTKAAVTLRDRAEKAGWRVQLTSVTGEWKDKEVHSSLLRLQHEDGRRMVGQWLDGKATSAYLWRGATVDPVEARISFRELAAEVKR